jgi:MoaA/NifB/PqqE/SkfB family radical SAM enzyme
MANLAYLQITRKCNQRCLFCSNPEIEIELSLEEARTALEKLKGEEYEGVVLTGGEPSLHPHLGEIVELALKLDLAVRMITNGQALHVLESLQLLKNRGLSHLHVSLHSMREEVQAALTGNPDSLRHLAMTLENAGELGLSVDVNTVICAQNADHLDLNVRWVVDRFPFVRHFVWNNIDPRMNRVLENPHTVAKLADLELALHRAASFLESSGRTFRIERLPLCYMADFAYASTETRKIVKGEQRLVLFLDDKGAVAQNDFFHDKAEVCQECRLSPICAGLYDLGGAYAPAELHAVFLDPEVIALKIRGAG